MRLLAHSLAGAFYDFGRLGVVLDYLHGILVFLRQFFIEEGFRGSVFFCVHSRLDFDNSD